MDDHSQNVKNNEKKGRGLFYGIIAVATLIIMGVGTTFAYFTATTNSTDTSVQTGSTTLKLEYVGYEGAWMSSELIPADNEVVEYSFEYQNDTTINDDEKHTDYETVRYNALCKDDYGNSICSVYVFQIFNTANSPQTVSLNVISTLNGFANLNAMGYEISAPTDTESVAYKNYNKLEQEIPSEIEGEEPTMAVLYPNNGSGDPVFKKTEDDTTVGSVAVKNGEGTFMAPGSYEPVYVNRLGVTKTLLKYKKSSTEILPAIGINLISVTEDDGEVPVKDRTARIADDIEIDGKTTKTFALVLYIENENFNQNDSDSNKTFSGQVVVSSGDGEVGVSGTISVSGKTNLQSGNTIGTDSAVTG